MKIHDASYNCTESADCYMKLNTSQTLSALTSFIQVRVLIKKNEARGPRRSCIAHLSQKNKNLRKIDNIHNGLLEETGNSPFCCCS